MAAQTRLFDEEKQELISEMAILRKNAEDFEKMNDSFEIRFALQKWLFLAKIKSLQEKVNVRDPDACCQAERQFFTREMKRLNQMSGAAVDHLKEELKFARSEVNECSQKISTLEFQNYVSAIKNSYITLIF